MATASTASSGTDDREPPVDPAAATPTSSTTRSAAPETQAAPVTDGADPASPSPAATAADHDPARRAFFRQFGRQAVTTVGQVAGMADVVGRTTGGATAGLLGLLGIN